MTTLVLSYDARHIEYWHRGTKVKQFFIYDTPHETLQRARAYVREQLGTDPLTKS